MSALLPYLWYPLFLTGAIVAFGVALSAGAHPLLAAYPPIIVTGLAIVLLEQRFIERPDWRPTWRDVKSDLAFMAAVQIAVPRLLGAAAVILLAGWMHDRAASGLWPHDWPLAVQVLLMVLLVDLMRYWLHRACHDWPLLWRLHEVHHSPDILYVVNVGRFHPFEKALHFCFDSVPFLLLGVAPEVLAGYFLLYSVNGFFQHSNLCLRYGWLNYVVGSAETHRWHHARDAAMANCNFGNTTIVWDLLFRTWYLPGPVGDIGIMDRGYPKGFRAQMLAPFRRGDGMPRRTPRAWLADVLVALKLTLIRWRQARRISAAVHNPMRVQRRLLRRIVQQNRDTRFGRDHDFAGIKTYKQFVARVPVAEYEALRPYIDAEIERGEAALTAEPPVGYARTSGTTGRAKDVPLTARHLDMLRHIHETAVSFQHRTCPAAFEGGIMAVVSPASEGTMPNGRSYGSASGIVARNTPALVREKFVVPQEVLTITDSRVKYLLILRLGLARRDVSYFGSANPTTLLTLIKLYREHRDALLADLREGGFFLESEVPAEVMHAVRPRLMSNSAARDRAAELLRRDAAHTRIADLWPGLRLIVTWTCASAGVAVQALRRELAPSTRVLELGYVSSEFRGTVTLGKRSGSGLPTLHAHFFEFVEREKWDRGAPEFLTLDKVEKGKVYYLVITTPSGLYRYFINDLVKVTGFLHRTPLLQFMQKGKGVTNITGEKLYEAQVLAAVGAVMQEMGESMRFMQMLADEEACQYRLYVEPASGAAWSEEELAEKVDAGLSRLNVEYEAKRESGRLKPPVAIRLAPETGEAYKQHCVEKGQREGQFKTVAVAYRRSFGFDLDAHAEAADIAKAAPVAERA